MRRVLIVDDDNLARLAIRSLLDETEYEFVESSGGMEAIEIHRKEPADVIITDIIMPEMSGIETIIKLVKEFPCVKIIAISGGISNPDDKCYLEVAKEYGAICALAKPVSSADLHNSLELCFSRMV